MSDRMCSVAGCVKEAKTRGWCSMHYQRFVRHGDVAVTKRTRYGTKECEIPGCGRPHKAQGLCSMHRYRLKRYGDPHVARNYVRVNLGGQPQIARTRLYKYGVTPERFNRILAGQGHRCAICGGDDPGGTGEWALDHNSETGQVRGVLCFWDNVGLGHFHHDPTRLRAAAEYLEHFAAVAVAQQGRLFPEER